MKKSNKKKIIVFSLFSISIFLLFSIFLFANKNKNKNQVHPTIEIFQETIEQIQLGKVDEIITLEENEKQYLKIFENAIKRVKYEIIDVKEENKIVILNVKMTVPDLYETEKKLLKKVQDSQSELSQKNEDEIEKISLKWFKEIIDAELNSSNLKSNTKNISVKYQKVGNEWTVVDDSELVKIFGFNIEQ